jgi:hypothetical protein
VDEDEIIDSMLDIFSRIVSSGQPIPRDLVEGMTAILQNRIQNPPEPPPAAPIPQGAELVWILAGGDPQAFTRYLRTIPDPALNQLSGNPEQLQNVMRQLSHRITMPAGEAEEGIPKADLQSSNVYGFSYNPRSSRLFVRFNNGGVYEYEGVPPQIFKIFAAGAVPAKTKGQNRWGRWWRGKNPSLGASFYELIRSGGYPYQKVA